MNGIDRMELNGWLRSIHPAHLVNPVELLSLNRSLSATPHIDRRLTINALPMVPTRFLRRLSG